MSTSEDVYWLYERNSKQYTDCVKSGNKNTCATIWNNECYCHENAPVCPFTIGHQDMECRMKVKTYIKHGEECPICMEKIISKKSAYLTGCGHSFHKLCIFKSFEAKWKKKYCSQFRCPMCRSNLGVIDMGDRYNTNTNTTTNINRNICGLDQLENFWLTKDFKLTHFCGNHFLGMNRQCSKCKIYVETGEII